MLSTSEVENSLKIQHMKSTSSVEVLGLELIIPTLTGFRFRTIYGCTDCRIYLKVMNLAQIHYPH